MLPNQYNNVYLSRDMATTTVSPLTRDDDEEITWVYTTRRNQDREAVTRLQFEMLDAYDWNFDVAEQDPPPEYIPPKPKRSFGTKPVKPSTIGVCCAKAMNKKRRMCYPRYSARG